MTAYGNLTVSSSILTQAALRVPTAQSNAAVPVSQEVTEQTTQGKVMQKLLV